MNVLAISGSLRAQSFNTALLRAAEPMAPWAHFTYGAIGDLPHFNADASEVGQTAVDQLRDQIGGADAVLIATPEYNYSIPGVLKNAIDWTSRPSYRSVWAGKPVGILGASPGAVGTARAQGHLRQVLAGMTAQVFPHPEFALGQAASRFTDLALTDERTRELLGTYLAAFQTWAKHRA